jgi:hypothetical protein
MNSISKITSAGLRPKKRGIQAWIKRGSSIVGHPGVSFCGIGVLEV